MKTNSCILQNKSLLGLLALISLLYANQFALAQASSHPIIYKDDKGWKIKVGQQDFFIKGAVWDPTPKGRDHTYDLWTLPDNFVQQALDSDLAMMKKAGINALRSSRPIPAKWVTYIYDRFGIMTVINPTLGRWGITIDGNWYASTDYSDVQTREILIKDALELVAKYKNVSGVLMFAFGNENNYGLSAQFSETKDISTEAKIYKQAESLYSLLGDVIRKAKQIDSNRLITIINGDIQHLDLIAEHCHGLDLIGTSVFRGKSFGNIWEKIGTNSTLPVAIMALGSDAFDARNLIEDQLSQAIYLKHQWSEIYKNSYGHSQKGNSLGGFVYEWRDQWWKDRQAGELYLQDNGASSANAAYTFDFSHGQNNINEEWFGITRIGDLGPGGIYESKPKVAYDILSEIWSIDPYNMTKEGINQHIDSIDVDIYSMKNDIRALREEISRLKNIEKENVISHGSGSYQKPHTEIRNQSTGNTLAPSPKFGLVGGSFATEFIIKGKEDNSQDDDSFTDGQMVFLDYSFKPTDRIQGDFSINILGNVAEKEMEFSYGRRGRPINVEVIDDDVSMSTRNVTISDNERVEIYNFQASYVGDNYDLNTFYHTPRGDWKQEGDFYGLLRSASDIADQDIWNGKAPYGAELIGKNSIQGLKLIVGPEIYWGANPKAIIKYEFSTDGGTQYAFMHSDDFERGTNATGGSEAPDTESSQSTVYAKTNIGANTTLEIGAITANTSKIGERYEKIQNTNAVTKEIELKDTLGIKARLSFDFSERHQAYLAIDVAGLVADGGAPTKKPETTLPYSELGNKKEIEGGMKINSGSFSFEPRFLYRTNFVKSIAAHNSELIEITGISLRDLEKDPFAVLDNREALSAEFFLRYDDTPVTDLNHWNADMIEDADLAFSIGFGATRHKTGTDAYTFFLEETNTAAVFPSGLPADDLWIVKNKWIYNPNKGIRLVVDLEGGKQQSTGAPSDDSIEYYSIKTKVIFDQKHIFSSYIEKDAFGQYSFFRQFNVTYPIQLKLDYSRALGSENRFGVQLLYRTLDENSPSNEYNEGENGYQFEMATYFIYNF